jgi:predicted phosphoribosyltransferase/pimeloyl-ACP methyl ester carboxylesterase
MATLSPEDDVRTVRIEPQGLPGLVGLPVDTYGLVIFAHGSGSSRLSPRNQRVAAILRHAGLATLLLDLLTPEEEENRRNVFDIDLLASRLVIATQWARRTTELAALPIGYFGASTGAGAALVAAARLGRDVGAVVSRGGRPDLAGNALKRVRAPTLLIVGGADEPVIGTNRSALDELRCRKRLAIVPGAGHLFEEPGALEQVARHARQWFSRFLPGQEAGSAQHDVFENRYDAGRQLAERLMAYKKAEPIVLALPRGGVPVAFEVAKALEAPLDVVFVRKIGAPEQPELGLGAVVDGADPQLVLNDDLVRQVGPSSAYIEAQCKRELAEIERRRELYRPGRQPPELRGRTVIVVDDGIATGGTVRAVLRAIARVHPKRLVLAVPVAPRETIDELAADADDIVCLSAPEQFRAVGLHYRDFTQTSDSEVVRLLRQV